MSYHHLLQNPPDGEQGLDASALFELFLDIDDEFFTLGVDGILSVELVLERLSQGGRLADRRLPGQ